MKYYLLLLSSFLLLSSSANAQFWQQTAGPGGDDVDAMAVNVKGDIFVAKYALHRSTDKGVSWTQLFTNTNPHQITNLIAQPSGRLFAQVKTNKDIYSEPNEGFILYSDNNGLTWEKLNLHSFKLWKGTDDVLFSLDSIQGLIKSTDDGSTWATIDTNGIEGTIIFATSTISGELLLSVVKHGQSASILFRSTDNGTSWSKIVNGIGGITNIFSAINGNLFAYTKTYGRDIYLSTDKGRTWINSITFSENIHTISVNIVGVIFCSIRNRNFYSSDNGISWTAIPYTYWKETGFDFEHASSDPFGSFLVSSEYGMFRISLPDSTFTRISVPENSIPAIIAHPDGNIVAFGGKDSLWVWRTDDEGDSWLRGRQSAYSYFPFIFSLAVDSSKNLFAATWRKIISSADSGAFWRDASPRLVDWYLSAIAVHSSGAIFATSKDEGIFRSTDNGATWDQLNKGISDKSLTSLALNQNGDLLTGGKNIIYKSTDNGLNWAVLTTNFPTNAGNVTALVVSRQGNIFAGIDSVGIFRSTDNGASWNKYSDGFTATRINTFVSTPIGKVFAATDSGVFYLDTASGANWKVYSTGLTTMNILSLCHDKNGRLFAGTDVSGVFRSLETFNTLSSEVKQTGNATEFALDDAFPNPASANATISFSITQIGNIQLDVLNVMGKVVVTIANGIYNAGSYSTTFDTKDLPAGIYYLRLQANGKILVKPIVKSEQ